MGTACSNKRPNKSAGQWRQHLSRSELKLLSSDTSIRSLHSTFFCLGEMGNVQGRISGPRLVLEASSQTPAKLRLSESDVRSTQQTGHDRHIGTGTTDRRDLMVATFWSMRLVDPGCDGKPWETLDEAIKFDINRSCCCPGSCWPPRGGLVHSLILIESLALRNLWPP